MTRILVTGGAGYVGSVSVEAFLAAGHEVVVLDDLTTGPSGGRPGRGDLPPGDLRGRGGHDPTAASTTGSTPSSIARRGRWSASRSPTRRSTTATTSPAGVALLEAARAAGVGRIVFSSTAAVYGVPDATPIPEDAPLRPINPYGESKRTFEGALDWYGRAYGLRSVSLRYFNVAGATETHRRGPRSGDAPHPERPGGRRGRRGADHLRRRLPDPGRDLHPRLHPRRRPRRRAPAGHRGDRAGRRPDRRPARLQPRQRRRLLDPGGRRGGGVGGRGDHPVPCRPAAGRRSAGPRRPLRPAPAEVLGWRPQRPSLESMVGSAWAWRRAHPDGYAD